MMMSVYWSCEANTCVVSCCKLVWRVSVEANTSWVELLFLLALAAGLESWVGTLAFDLYEL
jgi:hypothetical protein